MLPISDKFIGYASEVCGKLKELGYRCELDDRAEKIGYKIREAQLGRIPYMVIVGEKELESGNISVRKRDEGDLGAFMLDDFAAMLDKEIKEG